VVNTDTDVPFIIRGPIVPGNFLGTGTPALFADDLKGQESFMPGFRMTLGYRFNSGSAIELDWMHLWHTRSSANASLVPPNYANLALGGAILADTFLFSPFFNLPPEFAGPNQELALGNPGAAFGIFNGAINVSIDYLQRYDEANVRGRVPWFQDDCTRIYGTAGGRFAWIWERFRMRAVAANFLGQSTPTDVGLFTNTVSNRMYGPFVGFGFERYLAWGFAVGIEMEAAGLLDIAKQRAYLQNADHPVVTETTQFVRLKKAVNSFVVTPEVNANAQLYWYPWEGVQLRAGYNFMAFFNTIAAQDPVAFDARAFEPDWRNLGVRFLDGFNVGLGFIY